MSKKSTSAYLEFQLIGFYTENIFEKIDLDADITNSGEFDVDDDDAEEDNIEEYDDAYDDTDDTDEKPTTISKGSAREYKIYLVGRTIQNKTVCITLNGFTPFYYIIIPDYWKKNHCANFVDWILDNIDSKQRDGFHSWDVVEKKVFAGFTNDRNFKFIRLKFKNTYTMNKTIDLFIGREGDRKLDNETRYFRKYNSRNFTKYDIPLLGDDVNQYEFRLFESNIDPIFRFLHIQDIEPCGWVRIPLQLPATPKFDKMSKQDKTKYALMPNHPALSTCVYDMSCHWTMVQRCNNTTNMGFVIMSFDIETDSSHGDFPQAKKDYLKIARDLAEWWCVLHKKIDEMKKNKQTQDLETLTKQKANAVATIVDYLTHSFYSPYDPSKQNEVVGQLGTYHIFTKKALPTDFMASIQKAARYLSTLCNIAYNSVTIKQKSDNIDKMNQIMNKWLKPYAEIEGDQAKQIGLKFIRYGEKKCFKNILISYGTCDDFDDDTEVIVVETEGDLLKVFAAKTREYDPEFIIGYNIFNFDFPFLYHRAEECGPRILDEFQNLGRIIGKKSYLTEKHGKVKTLYLEIPGRIQIDIYKILQREQPNLDSYKLDNVSSHFIKSKIKKVEAINSGGTRIYVDDISGIYADNFIHLMFVEGYTENKMDQKFKVLRTHTEGKDAIITIGEDVVADLSHYKEKLWSLAKDDMSPKELFRRFKGNSADRALIGKYCMMDVNLCIELILKLQMITNNMGMANVCFTPLDWIFMRGQGVKILSLVSKTCREEDYLLPTLLMDGREQQKYEGAFVLPPKPGAYLDDYITVLDYNSLYPNSMIAENLSHETYCGAMSRCNQHNEIEAVTNTILNLYEDEARVCPKCINLNLCPSSLSSLSTDTCTSSTWLGSDGAKRIADLNLSYEDIPHDVFEFTLTKAGAIKSKTKIGVRICRFIQYSADKKGILPRILMNLLKARKDTRTLMTFDTIKLSTGKELTGVVCHNDLDKSIIIKDTNFKPICEPFATDTVVERKQRYNDFELSVLEGLQLAYKVTANSLYGQIGAKTSAIFLKDIAASTTATGRKQLLTAKHYVETRYAGSDVIYGDTDSIFVNFKPRHPETGELLKGKEGLVRSIELGKDVSKGIRSILKHPQNLGYEKTFYPFVIFSKKRYIGNKYEEDPTKFKQASMGIVLRRRDNCPLVKIFFGGVIDILMNKCDYRAAAEYCDACCVNLIGCAYPIEKLTISKMLNSHYKNPDSIAHKVLADRIGEREAGNRPQNGDRIPYVFIMNPNAVLQADKIENPAYTIATNLKVDFKYYITNQISKPVGQIFALFIEKLDTRYPQSYWDAQLKRLLDTGKDEYDARKKVMDNRNKIAIKYIFDRHVQELQRSENLLFHGQPTINSFFTTGGKAV
jgi:DNA polymerase elongation subunit (family B)